MAARSLTVLPPVVRLVTQVLKSLAAGVAASIAIQVTATSTEGMLLVWYLADESFVSSPRCSRIAIRKCWLS